MAGIRYWRLIGLCTSSQGALELSEARIYENGVVADASATLSATIAPDSGLLADLQDGLTTGVVAWPHTSYSQPGFALVWDFGSGSGVVSPQLRLGAGNSAASFPLDLTMQSSTNAVDWITYMAPIIAAEYPGELSLTALQANAEDPNWASVVLAMHMDGGNGSTTFTDAKGHDMIAHGAARITTDQSKFGGSSAVFGASTDNKVTSPASVDFALGGGPFTVAFWVYVAASNPAGGWVISAGGGAAAFNSTTGVHWLLASGVSSVNFQWWDGSSGRQTGPLPITMATWFHFAATYDGTHVRVFIGGTLAATVAASVMAPSTPPQLAIGELVGATPGANNAFPGYVDDLLITKGVACYTTSFTPVEAAFSGAASFVLLPTVSTPLPRASRTEPVPQRLLPATALPAAAVQGHLREMPFFDAYNGGIGIIYGTTKEKRIPENTPLTPLRRKVLLMDEGSQIVVRATWSDAVTGAFEFRGVKEGVTYTVLSYDHTGAYRAVVADHQVPELIV